MDAGTAIAAASGCIALLSVLVTLLVTGRTSNMEDDVIALQAEVARLKTRVSELERQP